MSQMKTEPNATRFQRIFTTCMAALLASAFAFAIMMGEAYTGVRTQNWIDRGTAPVMYWAYVAFTGLGALLLSAVALGRVGIDQEPARLEQRKRKRQRDGTIFALGCLLLGVATWVNELRQFGATPQDAMLGLFFLGTFGFVLMLAPLPPGALGAWLRVAAGALVAIAAVGMSLV
jgi:hypothetical protein